MPTIERNGDRIRLEMSVKEYRDLTDILISTGNATHHYGKSTQQPLIRKIRENLAQAAFAWASGMGLPPIEDYSCRKFHIDPFEAF